MPMVSQLVLVHMQGRRMQRVARLAALMVGVGVVAAAAAVAAAAVALMMRMMMMCPRHLSPSFRQTTAHMYFTLSIVNDIPHRLQGKHLCIWVAKVSAVVTRWFGFSLGVSKFGEVGLGAELCGGFKVRGSGVGAEILGLRVSC
jgi:hypothetical protein